MGRLIFSLTVTIALVSTSTVGAQATARDSVTCTLSSLFAAMQARDTAAVRSSFMSGGRVLPIQATSADGTLVPLSVDQFVRFVSGGAAPWIEKMHELDVRTSGGLADAWFNYDVHLGPKFSHCGVNAVQLARAASGWKIVSMAFTRAAGNCQTG